MGLSKEMRELENQFLRKTTKLVGVINMQAAQDIIEWLDEQTELPEGVTGFCEAAATSYADAFLDYARNREKLVESFIHFAPRDEEEVNMETAEKNEGRTLTVTYGIEDSIQESEAQELIRSNTPSGFSVQDMNLEQPSTE